MLHGLKRWFSGWSACFANLTLSHRHSFKYLLSWRVSVSQSRKTHRFWGSLAASVGKATKPCLKKTQWEGNWRTHPNIIFWPLYIPTQVNAPSYMHIRACTYMHTYTQIKYKYFLKSANIMTVENYICLLKRQGRMVHNALKLLVRPDENRAPRRNLY